MDAVNPVGLAVSDVEIIKARLPRNSSNLFTGDLQAYIQHITEQCTSEGDWILEFEPVNGMKFCNPVCHS